MVKNAGSGIRKRMGNLRPPVKKGEVLNPTGKNQYSDMPEELRKTGQAWWRDGGLARVIGYAENAMSKHHWRAIELLAKHFLPDEPTKLANADGSNLNGLFGVGYMALGNFTGASPANNPTEEPDEKV